MTPLELKSSVLKELISGKFLHGVEWDEECFKHLWEVTIWDKKFQGVEKEKQPEVRDYVNVLARDFPKIEDEDGDILILSTGLYRGFTSSKKIGNSYSTGEVVSMPGGGSANVKYWNGKFVSADNRIATSKDTTILNNKFLYYFLCSKIKELDGLYRGTGIKHPMMAKVLEILIPVPSIDDQLAVVNKIEDILPLIDEYSKSWSELETLNKDISKRIERSILEYALQGKLVEQLSNEKSLKNEFSKEELLSNSELFEIPDSWVWVKLDSVIIFQGGYAYKPTSYVDNSNNQLIRLGNVKMNHLILDDKQVFLDDQTAKSTANFEIKENDVLVTMTGTRKKKDYFFVALVTKDVLRNKRLFLNQRVGCLRARKINPEYLLYALQSNFIREAIFKKETGTANQGNIGSEDIKNSIFIPVPPLEEQARIVAKIKAILCLCKTLINE